MDAIEQNWPGPLTRLDLLTVDSEHPWPRTPSRKEIVHFTVNVLRGVRRQAPDIVVCGLLGLLPVATAAAKLAGRRLVLLAYGDEVWGMLPRWERELVRRCDGLVAISRYTAEHLARRVGIDAARIRLLALPIAGPLAALAIPPDESSGSARPASSSFLTVSRIVRTHRYKGHFDVARAFPRVLAERPEARWVVVGDGDDVDALHAECVAQGILPAVTFTGLISDAELSDRYREAVALVLPSVADADAVPPIGEGFGLVYAEAAAFGCPSIASSQGGGSSDFVIPGETGLTVPPHDPTALSHAMLRLMDDDELRASLSHAAHARLLANHMPAGFDKRLQEILVPTV